MMDKTLLQCTVLYCTILNCIVQYSVVAKKTERGDKRPEIKRVLLKDQPKALWATNEFLDPYNHE